MFQFEKLDTYQEAIQFTNEVYLLSGRFPKEEVFGLTSQLRRASMSIALNIAEGSSRTKNDFSHFLNMARGSCFECVALLTLASKLKYISQNELTIFYDKCDKLSRMTSKLKIYLSSRTTQNATRNT